jgi:hypothetical protein
VGDISDPVSQLNWADLACPPGQLAVGLGERQGGWTAQVTLFCAVPNILGGWSGPRTVGGAAGGDFGTHSASLICPAGQWITGMSGEMATAYYATFHGEVGRQFLANPVIYCGNATNAALSSFADTAFKPEKPSGLYPTTYAQTPTQYCAAGAVAGRMRIAVSAVHHPDIKAIKFECVRAPVPQAIPRIPFRNTNVHSSTERNL